MRVLAEDPWRDVAAVQMGPHTKAHLYTGLLTEATHVVNYCSHARAPVVEVAFFVPAQYDLLSTSPCHPLPPLPLLFLIPSPSEGSPQRCTWPRVDVNQKHKGPRWNLPQSRVAHCVRRIHRTILPPSPSRSSTCTRTRWTPPRLPPYQDEDKLVWSTEGAGEGLHPPLDCPLFLPPSIPPNPHRSAAGAWPCV